MSVKNTTGKYFILIIGLLIFLGCFHFYSTEAKEEDLSQSSNINASSEEKLLFIKEGIDSTKNLFKESLGIWEEIYQKIKKWWQERILLRFQEILKSRKTAIKKELKEEREELKEGIKKFFSKLWENFKERIKK